MFTRRTGETLANSFARKLQTNSPSRVPLKTEFRKLSITQAFKLQEKNFLHLDRQKNTVNRFIITIFIIEKNSAGIILEASIVSFLTNHFDVENFIYGDMSYSAGSKAMNLYVISD